MEPVLGFEPRTDGRVWLPIKLAAWPTVKDRRREEPGVGVWRALRRGIRMVRHLAVR